MAKAVIEYAAVAVSTPNSASNLGSSGSVTRIDAALANAVNDSATMARVGTDAGPGAPAVTIRAGGQASESGRLRMRLPVAAASALATAGAIGGTPGSPTPVGFSVDGTMCTSTAGISPIRSTG